MKFPRNARIFRGRLDAAPFAAVFFLLMIFLMLASLVYTPGVHIQLPVAADLPGTDKPTVQVAIDKSGQLYFENEAKGEQELKDKLIAARKKSGELTLVVQADRAVSYEQLLHVVLLARDAGIRDALLATLPQPLSPPAPRPVP
jgi:biopolymer transport protein ExbD